MIVARLVHARKLAGFHFNDSKYGDDDLDSGSIDPYQLFLIFNELVDAELGAVAGFDPAYMLDQSHNVTDPAESLMTSAGELLRAYVQAHLVDRGALEEAQEKCDALMALGYRATLDRMRTDQADTHPALDDHIHPFQTSLASQFRRAAHRQLRHRNAGFPRKLHVAMHAPLHTRKPRAQSRELGKRNRKVDAGLGFGQPVDIERLRPGRRHGARIIGIASSQVKVRFRA